MVSYLCLLYFPFCLSSCDKSFICSRHPHRKSHNRKSLHCHRHRHLVPRQDLGRVYRANGVFIGFPVAERHAHPA
jgi:hypothetical protein